MICLTQDCPLSPTLFLYFTVFRARNFEVNRLRGSNVCVCVCVCVGFYSDRRSKVELTAKLLLSVYTGLRPLRYKPVQRLTTNKGSKTACGVASELARRKSPFRRTRNKLCGMWWTSEWEQVFFFLYFSPYKCIPHFHLVLNLVPYWRHVEHTNVLY